MSTANQHRRRAAVHTLGCRLNQAESGLIVEQLQAGGYVVVPFTEPADLGIVNTCTVTREADAKSRQLIRSFIRRNPDAFVAVIGCYSEMDRQALAEIPGIDLILGNEGKLRVLDYVVDGKNDQPVVVHDRLDRNDFAIEPVGDGPVTKRANLKIQDGCNFFCSYCIIPYARGRERSRDFENLTKEARDLVARGAKELVLTGINVGRYANEGRGILDVVDTLDTIPGLGRIRISSIEMSTIQEDLFDRMNDAGHALVPFLHIPTQSGSDRVLEFMRRKYRRDELLAFMNQARQRVDDVCIGTDVMVGMPGETDDDFAQTMDFLDRSPVAYAHVFKYSERPGTPAAAHPDKVDPRVMNYRSAQVRDLGEARRAAFDKSFLGKTMAVLFEDRTQGAWAGYTGNYVRVAARSTDDLTNEIRRVKLTGYQDGVVQGELDEGH
ncbi:MAG: tRNA (N(6)-L-threonylcarbamoyladenosine(37)-C(2))-methylthiotransferase MtaB [bacterium]|nr:tRNA (N(6)-L-threonylcarbamoyladenosine(37)-C(2))-methylthiotransferase MtaB [bacterium]